MDIRSPRPDEYFEIAKVWYESAGRIEGGAPRLDEPRGLAERIECEIAIGRCWQVATVDGRVVGLLAINFENRVLEQLFVAHRAQRGGIGTALLDWAKCQLPNGFTLRTAITNAAAQRFYERHGLRALEDGSHPKTGDPVRYFEWPSAEALASAAATGRAISPRTVLK